MLFEGLEISTTGMLAQRVRMDVVSSNLANANSVNDKGEPYQRRIPVFEAVLDKEMQEGKNSLPKVHVKEIAKDKTPFKLRYDPANPLADKNGYVKLPNINPLKEMVDMISAMRSYEANLTAFNSHKDLLLKAIEIIKA